MKDKILEQIKQLEKDRGIKVLFAAESGSRAWGFPSPDSDYDVRFFYIHELDWYISLGERKDTIDLGVNELLDINGWELRKAMRLMKKSNIAPLEWVRSPIVYYEIDGFRAAISQIDTACFSPIGGMHHYLSMAMKFYERCAGDAPVPLKAWFYGLRAALNARWILERQTLPPVYFPDVLVLINTQKTLVRRIHQLIELKAKKDEHFLFERDEILLELMQNCIKQSDLGFKTMPGSTIEFKMLNTIFRKIVKYDY